jgi:GT2 family glycosyltransferase
MQRSFVDVIVPIYNAPAMLRACLDALLDRLPLYARLHLVDDASPDPAVADVLAIHPVTARRAVSVRRNPENLGFVRTVNAAMSACDGDVVLLNSDTVVTHGWLDRITACAASDPRIASVTPFSNNAEICSLPEFCHANPVPADPERWAQAAVAAGPPEYPDLPTAVGFCMFMRRAAIDEIGLFDADTFGRGYGEENDWCLRAAAHGWRNVLCDDAYVVHVGGASFAGTGHRPGGEQLARLVARYPHYNDLVAAFIRADPLAGRRRAILARYHGLTA